MVVGHIAAPDADFQTAAQRQSERRVDLLNFGLEGCQQSQITRPGAIGLQTGKRRLKYRYLCKVWLE